MHGDKILFCAFLPCALLAGCKDESMTSRGPAVAVAGTGGSVGTGGTAPVGTGGSPAESGTGGTTPVNPGTVDGGSMPEPEPAPPDAAPADASPFEPNPFLGRVAPGSRLKPLYARTIEGQRFFLLEWMDTEQKVRCSFTTAEDGMIRCLPLAPRNGFLTYFADPQCSQRLYPAEQACAAALGTVTAAGRTSVYRLGPPSSPAMVYSLQGTGNGPTSCLPDKTGTGKSYFSVGAKVPSTTFVASENRIELLPNRRIVANVRTATDGMRERSVWYDVKLRQNCQITRASDGSWRCQPYPSNTLPLPQTFFADAACTEGLAPSTSEPTALPRYFQILDDKVCPPRLTFHPKVLRMPTNVYRKTGTACTAEAPAPGLRYYGLGAALPPTEFVAFTETVDDGGGRLQQRVLTSSDGAIDRISTAFDKQFGDLCDFELAADGKLRCLPRTLLVPDTFSDSACAKKVGYEAPVLNCTSRNNHVTRPQGPWCSPVVQAFRLGAPVTTTYQHNAAGTCVAVNYTGFAVLGEALPATGFAEAQLDMD